MVASDLKHLGLSRQPAVCLKGCPGLSGCMPKAHFPDFRSSCADEMRSGRPTRHARRLALTGHLTRNTRPMTTGNSAGIKRNRRPKGVKVVESKVWLEEATDRRLREAGLASGSLSLSLYLERLVSQLEAENGGLPVLSPTLGGVEVTATTAA